MVLNSRSGASPEPGARLGGVACTGCQCSPPAGPQGAGLRFPQLVEQQGPSPRSALQETQQPPKHPVAVQCFWVGGKTLRLTRGGSIPLAWSRPLPAVPNGVTLSKDCAGRYGASFVVAVEREPLPPSGNAVGVEPGWASLAATSDGVKRRASRRYSSAPLSRGFGGCNGVRGTR